MVFDKVKEVISEQMNVSAEKITVNTSFSDDLGADSLDVFQIISELEQIFDLEFSNEDAEKIKTVGHAVDYIKARVDA